VSIHYLLEYKYKKLTIIYSKRVGEQNTLPTKNAENILYDATLC